MKKIILFKNQQYRRWDCDLAPCLSVGKPASKAGKLIVWESKWGRFAPCQVPWSECTMDFVLKMSKATGCDYYFGTAGRNLVCQDFCAGCCKPLPPLWHSDSQWLSPTHSSKFPVMQDLSRGSHKATYNAGRGGGGSWLVPGFSFPNGESRGSGETSLHGAGMGNRQCG